MSPLRHLSPVILQIVLFVALICEVLSSTFWLQIMPINACRWIHFLSGMVIGATILIKTASSKRYDPVSKWVVYLLLCWLIIWVGIRLNLLFRLNPLDYTLADMLPVIQVMAQRLYQLQPVYEIIPEIWEGVMPIYLPGLWIPFVPAVVLNYDLRWTTVCFIFLGLFMLFTLIRANKRSLLVWIPIGLWFDYLLYNKNETLVLSEEGVVYGYYMLFALLLYLRSYIGIGVLLACCLLSRYSIVFFAGALMVTTYLYEERRKFKKLFFSFTITSILLITLGSAWFQLIQFVNLPNQYLKNLEANPSKYQDLIREALGFVPWMESFDFKWIYRMMLILLIVVAILTILYYRKFQSPFYLLAGLKFTLLIFYHFILIPYPYLFYTSVWVSMIIFFIYSNHSQESNQTFTT